MRRTYREDNDWSVNKIQPIAEKLFYQKYWPDSRIIHLDTGDNELKKILDVGGADKLIAHSDGSISFLAQRFRTYEFRKYDEFTIRAKRPSGHLTEFEKMIKGIKEKGLLSAYYSYGHVNEDEDEFLRFRIIDYLNFAKMVLSGELSPGKLIPNKDGSAYFYAWKFKNLPHKLILFEYPKPKILQMKLF